MKIYCDKTSIKFLFIALAAATNPIIIVAVMGLFSQKINFYSILITILIIIFSLVLFRFAYLRKLEKTKNFILIEDDIIKYNHKKSFEVPFSLIKEIESDDVSKIIIYTISGVEYQIIVDKAAIKALSDILDLKQNIKEESLKIKFDKGITRAEKKAVDFLSINIYKVFTGIVGTILSIISIYLYENYKTNILIIVSMSIISLLFAGFQLYKIYYRDFVKERSIKIIYTILFLLLYIIIVFTIITIISIAVLKIPFSYDYAMYAIYVTPAFLLVLLLIVFTLYILQYA